jgi:hypothetical protein
MGEDGGGGELMNAGKQEKKCQSNLLGKELLDDKL